MTLRTEDGQHIIEISDSNRIRVLSLHERQIAGLKTGTIWFTGTLVSAFIPVLHFFLVPLGACLAAFFTYKAVTKTLAFDLTGLKCPKCNVDLGEPVLRSKGSCLKTYCYSCRSGIDIFL